MEKKQIWSMAPPCNTGVEVDKEEDHRLPESQQRWRSDVASYQIQAWGPEGKHAALLDTDLRTPPVSHRIGWKWRGSKERSSGRGEAGL
jgi:hypothetical protein